MILLNTFVVSLLAAILKYSSANTTFPLKEFFNISDADFLAAHEYHLCKDSLKSIHHCCSCLPTCVKLKNCCLDYLWKRDEFEDVQVYKEYLLELSRQSKNQVCKKVFAQKSSVKNTDHKYIHIESKRYFMVDRCLQGSDEKDVFMCEKISSNKVPVLGDDDYLYQNSYCAKCNNVKEMKMLTVKLECSIDGFSCSIGFKELSSMYQNDQCFSLTKNCPVGNEYYELCYSFVAPYQGYANYYCYLCNDEKLIDFFSDRKCFYLQTFRPISWATLLQFGGSSTSTINDGCEDKKVYDVLGKCTSYACPTGYQAHKGRCRKKDTRLSISYGKTHNKTFDECFFTQNITITIRNLSSNKVIMEYLTLNYGSSVEIIKDALNVTVIRLKRSNEGSHQIEDLSYFLKENESVLLTLDRNSGTNITNQICNERINLVEDMIFTEQCDAVVDSTVFSKWNLLLSLNITKYRTKRSVHMCEFVYDGCPLRILDDAKKLRKLENGTLVQMTKEGSKIYKLEEYTMISENVYGVCLDVAKSQSIPSWYTTIQIIDGYISISGSFLSIISYMIVLTTFYLFEQPFNLPTYCAIALCISLFFADLLFLSINILHFFSFDRSSLTCDIIGSVDHFFLISGQIWCVIMAVNLFNSLKTVILLNQSSIRSRFIKCCFISYTSSLFTVILAIVLRETRILDEEYESREVCLFQAGPLVRMVLHTLPLILSFTASILFISISIYIVARENERNNEILGRTRYVSITRIALKLIIMFGIPEGIGLIYIPKTTLSNNELYINLAFGVLYSIAKGCRGILLLLLYVCKKSVFDLYKARFFLTKGEKRVQWKVQQDSATTVTTHSESASTTF